MVVPTDSSSNSLPSGFYHVEYLGTSFSIAKHRFRGDVLVHGRHKAETTERTINGFAVPEKEVKELVAKIHNVGGLILKV